MNPPLYCRPAERQLTHPATTRGESIPMTTFRFIL